MARGREYCSQGCRNIHKKAIRFQMVEKGLISLAQTLVEYLNEKRGHKCERCGLSEWMGAAIPLDTHHIDGIASHNLPANIQRLCKNCHAQTPTFGARNIGHGRPERRARYLKAS